jgi:protein MAK16
MNDDVTWSVLGQHFCCYKVEMRNDPTHRFCRNPYNQTGICSRHTCPLANSQYATVIEHDDELYLYVKTAERAHLPRRQWEKTKLAASFPEALKQVDEELQWWDRRHVNRVKARLLRLKQYLMRKKKMMTEADVEYVSVNKRQEDKLLRREAKAEKAARIELEIEKELLERLRQGTYDSVINANQEAFEKLLDEEEVKEEEEEELEEDEEDLDPYVMDEDEEDEEDLEDIEDIAPAGRKRQRLIIEREVEHETPAANRRRLEAQEHDLDW